MTQRICFLLALSIFFSALVGCDDLSKHDLSSQILLELKTDGSTYLKIYEFTDRGKDLSELKPGPKSSSVTVSDLLRKMFTSSKTYVFDLSDLYVLLEFAEASRVGEANYIFKVNFIENPPYRFNYLQVLNDQREEVPLTILEDDTKTGLERVNLHKDGYGTRHHGYGLASFTEPISNRKYLIDIEYDIECTPMKNEEDDIDGYEIPASIKISIEAKLGNPHYLAGTLPLKGKKPIEAQVLDWDLDGVFTNTDRVRIGEQIFPLNEHFKIGRGKKEKEYMITLAPGETGEEYVLTIERIDEGGVLSQNKL
ncbi:MAG TPA: hypothetical protein GXZ36_03340 [Firmicutes bacterium]|nr:hypothetical protein [Bacillota bacterium]